MRLLQKHTKYLKSSPRLFNHTFCSKNRGSLPSFVAILRAIEIDISRQSELFLRYNQITYVTKGAFLGLPQLGAAQRGLRLLLALFHLAPAGLFLVPQLAEQRADLLEDV